MRSSPERLDVFDVIKGLCMAYIVAFWHMMEYVPGASWVYSEFGTRFTVGLLATFVFVSGYLSGVKGTIPFGRPVYVYFANRFRRIYVPFFLALLVFYFCGFCGGRVSVQAAALVSMFVPPAPPTLWFITMIVVYYAVVPVLLAVRGGLLTYFACVSVLFAIVAGLLFWGLKLDSRLLIYFPAFAVGCYASKGGNIEGLSLSVVSVGVVLAYLVSSINSDNPAFDLHSIFFATIFPVFVVRLFSSVVVAIPSSALNLFRLLAEASFFMYLLHRPIYFFAQKVIGVFELDPSIIFWVYAVIVFPMVCFVSLQLTRAYGKYIDPMLGRALGLTR